MRASTQHLIDAVSGLADAVEANAKAIDAEIASLKSKISDGADDSEIEAQISKITDLTAGQRTAATNAQAALASVPQDDGAVGVAAQPGTAAAAPVSAAALPPDTATNTNGRDPASGAPAGQGAVGAGNPS